MRSRCRNGGFTLVELIVVIVITGVLAGTLVVFFKPALDSYLDVGRRATLTDMADTALKSMSRDIRMAVPNSVRLIDSKVCFALSPTADGAIYRTAPDKRPAAPATYHFNPLVPNATAQLDLLSPIDNINGKTIVINNINGDDVYTGASRATVSSFQALTTVSTPTNEVGTARIGFASKTFPAHDRGGYLFVVPADEQVVYYIYSSSTKKLYRLARTFAVQGNTAPTSCPSIAGAAVLADSVADVTFSSLPNQGAGADQVYMQLTIKLSANGEDVQLSYGVSAENRP